MTARGPNNARRLAADNLDTCADCGAPATSWRDGPRGAAEGVCDRHRGPVVLRQVSDNKPVGWS